MSTTTKRASKAQTRTDATPVVILNSKGNPKRKFASIYQAATKTGVNSGSISKAVRGIVNTAGGFRWKLA
jgi:hypothetical protein